MTEQFQVDPMAISVLAETLKADFGYLLSRETAHRLAELAIQKIALMQEYSGNKVWSKKDEA